MASVPLRFVKINDSYWTQMHKRIAEVVLPYQWDVLNNRVKDAEPSYCMENFKAVAGKAERIHRGVVFLDSDVYKWLEAVAYSITVHKNPAMEQAAEEAIAIIGAAQCEDGYLNTYYTLCAPDQRFCNFTDGHELYCAGHLIEAAVAYYEATGRDALLSIARRFADCLVQHFLREDGENRGCPGHPEIELALIRLYSVTAEEAYLRLCAYFLDVRGTGKPRRDIEREQKDLHRHFGDLLFSLPVSYAQAHAPVRKQRDATGHAVRAMYLYSAMADMAAHTGETAMNEAVRALYESTVQKNMYVTGGIGSAAFGECFTTDYDLPNDTVYAETCASIGLMMLSRRMWHLTHDAACYDIWERALYNTVMAGMSQDGRHFFYVNPLYVNPAVLRVNESMQHVLPSRAKWFGVACCPTNLARTVLSMGASLYAREEGALYVLSHIASSFTDADISVSLSRDGDAYTLAVDGDATEVRLRIPDGYALENTPHPVQDGYLTIAHPGGKETYGYRLIPRVRMLHAHPHVAADAGKVCVALGAQVYCLEEADNGAALCALSIPVDARFEKVEMDFLPEGMVALRTQGIRYMAGGSKHAYSEIPHTAKPQTLTFIPYSQWSNRGVGEMTVWVQAHRAMRA